MPGRKKGARNKKTLQREFLEEVVKKRADAAYAGRKLAKEVLEELMTVAMSFVAKYQPHPANERFQNEPMFIEWLKIAQSLAADLAPYQSPTFRAVVIGQAPEAEKTEGDIDEARRKIGKLLEFRRPITIEGSASEAVSSDQSSAVN